jgi:uncharacterized membrane protein
MEKPSHRVNRAAGPAPGLSWRVRTGAALLGLAGALALPAPAPWSSRIALAYLVGMTVLFSLTFRVIARPTREEMQAFVRREGSQSWGPLVAAGGVAIGSMATLAYLLRTVTHQAPGVKGVHVAASLLGVLVGWATLHMLFALSYAALYYEPAPGQPEQPAGGLAFPEEGLTPDYWDFLYFSFVIGMCYQTSDVSITGSEIRRYTLLHSIFAYLYGVGILSMVVSAVIGDL